MTKSSAHATTVGVHEAKTNLSKLLRLVEDGEDVQITRGGTPVARLVPVAESSRTRRLGTLRGQIWMAADFDAPLDDIEEAIDRDDVFPA